MSLFTKMLTGLRHFSLVEYGLYEITVFLRTLLLIKLFPRLLSLNVWWYVGLAVVFGAVFFYRLAQRADQPSTSTSK